MKNIFTNKIKTVAAVCCTSAAIIASCPMTSLAYSGHDFDRIGDLSGYSRAGVTYMVGDCNCDGYIGIADYITLNNYCNQLEGGFISWWCAIWSSPFAWRDNYDINGDGWIDRTDANILYDYVT
jgi:hypothetical protein